MWVCVCVGFVICGCLRRFCNVWMCVSVCVCVGFVMYGVGFVMCGCVGFVMCGCVYVCTRMCGFCKVWVYVCVGFVMCGYFVNCVGVW